MADEGPESPLLLPTPKTRPVFRTIRITRPLSENLDWLDSKGASRPWRMLRLRSKSIPRHRSSSGGTNASNERGDERKQRLILLLAFGAASSIVLSIAVSQ